MKKKTWTSVLLWVLAFLLTALTFVYQRMTGPTYPVRGKEILKGIEISYFLLRSYTTDKGDMPVRITAPDNNITAFLNYKRYNTNDDWKEVELKREEKGKTAAILILNFFSTNLHRLSQVFTGKCFLFRFLINSLNSSVVICDYLCSSVAKIITTLMAEIPGQPAAGKVEYSIRVNIDGENFILNKGKSVVARFKGPVPSVFLILHIIFMFFSILFAFRTCMEALIKEGNYYWMVNWTLGIVFIGGMILGPIVQEYTFGDFWTGFPFGFDLTDNKVLIAVIFWLVAFFLKKKNKWWVVLAAVVMLVIYLIPHSVLGSELDYSTGKMKNKYSYRLEPGSLRSQPIGMME